MSQLTCNHEAPSASPLTPAPTPAPEAFSRAEQTCVLDRKWRQEQLLGCHPSAQLSSNFAPEAWPSALDEFSATDLSALGPTEPWARDFSADSLVIAFSDEPFSSAHQALWSKAAAPKATASAPLSTPLSSPLSAPLEQAASLAAAATAAPLASEPELTVLTQAQPARPKAPWYVRWSLGVAALVVLFFVGIYLHPAMAAATDAGTALPYESWLSDFQKSLTGPVAFAISLIGIVVSGISLILGGGEIRGFARTMVYIVLVMTLLIGANSLMSNFFNGASLPLPEQSEVVGKPQTDPAPTLRARQQAQAAATTATADTAASATTAAVTAAAAQVFAPELMALYALDQPRFDSYQTVPWDEVAHSLRQRGIEGALLVEDLQERSEYRPPRHFLAQQQH